MCLDVRGGRKVPFHYLLTPLYPMKYATTWMAFAVATGITLAGCSSRTEVSTVSQPATVAEVRTSEVKKSRSSKEAPAKGMTKNEVVAVYGKPSRVSKTGNGEVWHYNYRPSGRNFIPGYGAFAKNEVGTIIFDAAGCVTASDWHSERFAYWKRY